MGFLFKAIVMVLSTTVLLSSCEGCGGRNGFFTADGEEEREVRQTLDMADSLMESDPDTAYALLRKDSAIVQGMGKAKRMRFALLKTQAEDKLYVTHKSDSVMREVADYYEKHGNERQKAQAYYMLGRVCYDLYLRGSALSAFKKTLDIEAHGDSIAYRYITRAAMWVGDMFADEDSQERALSYRQQALRYAQSSDLPSLAIYTLRDIARSYRYMDCHGKAIAHYEKAAQLAKSLHDAYLYNMVEEELALSYMELGMNEKALCALKTPHTGGNDVDIASRQYYWGLYYEKTGNADSALEHYKKALPHSTLEDSHGVLTHIAEIYAAQGDMRNAIKYYSLSCECLDSLNINQSVEYKNLVNYVENNMENIRHNEKLIRERNRLAVLSLTVVLCAVIALSVIWQYYTKRNKENEIQRQRIKAYWVQKQEMDSALRKNQEHISLLEEELSSSKKLTELERQIKVKDVECLKFINLQLGVKKEQDVMLLVQLRKSQLFLNFHSENFMPTNQDFADLATLLDKTYDNFTERLKVIYPAINMEELQVCCLIKIGLTPSKMAKKMQYNNNVMSMMRFRLYRKIFGERGSAEKMDAFIKDF